MDYSPASFVNFFSAQDLRMEANGRMRLVLPLQLFRDGRCRQAKCDAAMPRRLPRRAIPCRSSSSIDDRAPESQLRSRTDQSGTSVQGLLHFTDQTSERGEIQKRGCPNRSAFEARAHTSLCLALFPGLGGPRGAPAERPNEVGVGGRREIAETRHLCWLLCPHRQRPRCRAAEQRDELAPFQNGTSGSMPFARRR